MKILNSIRKIHTKMSLKESLMSVPLGLAKKMTLTFKVILKRCDTRSLEKILSKPYTSQHSHEVYSFLAYRLRNHSGCHHRNDYIDLFAKSGRILSR